MYRNEKQITLTRYRDLMYYNCEHFYSIEEKEEYRIIGKDAGHLYLRKGIETSCVDLDSPILIEVLIDADNLVLQTFDNLPTKDQVTIGMLQELLRASLRDLRISPSCLTCSMSDTDMCKEIHDGGCTNYRWKYEAEVRALLEDNSICQSCAYYRDGQCKGENSYNACPTNHII